MKIGLRNIKIYYLLMLSLVFIFIFYSKLNPIIPYDTDDWYYMSYFRYPIPLWGDWNPTRILPEILMPNLSIAAAYTIYPLTGDYIGSMVIIYAIVMSLIISILCCELYKLFNTYSSSSIISFLMTLVWIILHFTLLVNSEKDNTWLWSSITAACYFYYTIPALINEIIVVHLLRKSRDISKRSWVVLIVVGYFGIFSNLFPAIILGSYAGVDLLFSLGWYIIENRNIHSVTKKGNTIIKREKSGNNTKESYTSIGEVLKKNAYNIYLITLFFISIYFEMYGGRASGFDGFDLKGAAANLAYSIATYNKPAVCSVILILIIGIFKSYKTRNDKRILIDAFKLFLPVFPLVIFLILVCSKAGSWYIGRADVHLVIVFFPLLSILYLLSRSISCGESISSNTEKDSLGMSNEEDGIKKQIDATDKHRKLIFLFLVIALIINITVLLPYNNSFYKPTNISSLEPEVCKKIDEDIVSQILTAKEQGISSMELHVPKFSTEDNWPMAVYSGGYQSRFPYTLWVHGLIEDGIYVTIVPDEAKNKEFGILI